MMPKELAVIVDSLDGRIFPFSKYLATRLEDERSALSRLLLRIMPKFTILSLSGFLVDMNWPIFDNLTELDLASIDDELPIMLRQTSR